MKENEFWLILVATILLLITTTYLVYKDNRWRKRHNRHMKVSQWTGTETGIASPYFSLGFSTLIFAIIGWFLVLTYVIFE